MNSKGVEIRGVLTPRSRCGLLLVAWRNDAYDPATRVPMEGLSCLLYTSDAADERSSVDLGGRRIIKKKKKKKIFFFFFKQKTAYEMLRSLVGSEMCIRDSRMAERRV